MKLVLMCSCSECFWCIHTPFDTQIGPSRAFEFILVYGHRDVDGHSELHTGHYVPLVPRGPFCVLSSSDFNKPTPRQTALTLDTGAGEPECLEIMQ